MGYWNSCEESIKTTKQSIWYEYKTFPATLYIRAEIDSYVDSAKFHFVLKDIDYTIYHNWDTTEIIDTGDITFGPDLSIKKKLRKGDYKTLNVYFVYGLGVHNLSGVVFSPSAVKAIMRFCEYF